MRVGGNVQVFRAAFGDGLLQQIAPRVIAICVAPVFCLILENLGCAISSSILRRGQAVQRIVSKCLVAVLVFVIDDSENIAIVGAIRSSSGRCTRRQTSILIPKSKFGIVSIANIQICDPVQNKYARGDLSFMPFEETLEGSVDVLAV
jgi:hypothetical protein